jgi:uncharacterized membrane-anchored protein
MAENSSRPSILRIVAAVFLGIVVGFFVFFAITLVLGALNIPVSMQFAENIYSAILLIISLAVCIGGFLYLVWTNPPTEAETEETLEE